MIRARAVLFALALLPLAACKKADSASPDDATPASSGGEAGAEAKADEFEGREVVDNWEAEVGEVTVCPISGKKFEVDDESGRYSYQGYDFVFCCKGTCLDKVEADPGKYLDALVQEAGGPASDPDPAANEGGAVDDTAQG